MNETTQPAVAGPVQPTVRPCAWMAQHGREPVQATVSKQQADAWAQAGGDVVELYDGLTFWNAIASADARRRELQSQIEQLQDRLARAGIEQQRAVRERHCKVIAYMAVSRSGTARFTDNPDAARELERYGWAITPLADAGPNVANKLARRAGSA